LVEETAMRSGEAKRLLWTEIDTVANTIRLNNPEKGSNPRMWQVSSTLIGMLNALPKTCERVFGAGPAGTMKSTYWKSRKCLAAKLKNPRLLKITFHTFRHWKATMLYHEKPDTLYVRDFLGHKELRNTERYITIARTIFGPGSNDKFIIKVAKDAPKLLS
jgi:integrase